MKRSYGPFLMEALLFGGAFMVVVFLLLLGIWKLLGVALASSMIFGFQLGFSGSIYMISIPLLRCTVKNMSVETYHFGYLVIGAVIAFFTYTQLVQVEEFRLEILRLLLLGPPLGMFLALWIQKSNKKAQQLSKAV